MNITENSSNFVVADRPTVTSGSPTTGTEGHPRLGGLPNFNLSPNTRKWLQRCALGVAFLALVAGAITYYEMYLAPFESTDDAFIEGNVTAVAPEVAGRVVRVLVNDNQPVKAGQVLLQIDSQDFDVKIAQARAALAQSQSRIAQAQAQLAVDEANAEEATANVTAAEADATRAAADWQRYASIESRAVSKSQIDLAQDEASTATARLEVARNRAKAASAQIDLGKADVATAEAEVAAAQAFVKQAELNLSYTQIVAPVDGFVTHRTVEQGTYVQPGQPLLAVVPNQVWIIANFKETQLTQMRPGQPVEVSIDAYPQHKFKGHVDSIQTGGGARFSLLPPENAIGNYVKVVQRVPVKIILDEAHDPAFTFGPGMSAVPFVRVR